MGYIRHSLKEQAKRKRFQHWHHQSNVKWEIISLGLATIKIKPCNLKSVFVGIDAMIMWAERFLWMKT